MSRLASINDKRVGPRYVAVLPVRVEWKATDGKKIIEEGKTENVGPEGTLVHLNRLLPDVGSRVSLTVMNDDAGKEVRVVTEVLRIERNAAHPQAALLLVNANREWRNTIWERAAPRPAPPAKNGDEAPDDEDDALLN